MAFSNQPKFVEKSLSQIDNTLNFCKGQFLSVCIKETSTNCDKFEENINSLIGINQRLEKQDQSGSSAQKFSKVIQKVSFVIFLMFLIRAWIWEPEILEGYLNGTIVSPIKRLDLVSIQAVHQIGLDNVLRKLLLHQVTLINSANWRVATLEDNLEINSWITTAVVGFLVLANFMLTMDIVASSMN